VPGLSWHRGGPRRAKPYLRLSRGRQRPIPAGPRNHSAAIEAEIAHLRSLAIDALRRDWRVIFGRTPPAGLSKDLLKVMVSPSYCFLPILRTHSTAGFNLKMRTMPPRPFHRLLLIR